MKKVSKDKSETKKTKRKEPPIILKIIIKIIIAILFGLFFINMDFTLEWAVILSVIFTLSLNFLIPLSNKIKRNKLLSKINSFFVNFFRFILIPFIIFIHVLIGAINAKYPHETKYLENIGTNLSVAANSFTQGFMKLFQQLYDMGYSRPTFFIFLFIAMMIIGLWLSWPDDSVYYEQLEAQELIDSVTDKDLETKPNLLHDVFDKVKRRPNKK